MAEDKDRGHREGPFLIMRIVPLEEIPNSVGEVPKDNAMKILTMAQEMESLCRAKDGMGISATQVGIPWKMFVYWSNYPSEPKTFSCMVDCKYAPLSETKFKSIEGCLSIPGSRFELERYDEIFVSGKRLVLKEDAPFLEEFREEVFRGVTSVILQHEIDHNFGRERMIDKIGKPIQVSFAWRKE